MTEATTTPETTEVAPTETTSTTTGNVDKKFSQADLDAVVKNRVEREKAATKKAIETATSEQQRLATDLETANTVLESYKTVVQKLVDAQLKGLPPSVKDLLAKLDPAEQLSWLEAHSGEFVGERKSVPPVPSGKGNKVPEPGDILASKKRFFNSI